MQWALWKWSISANKSDRCTGRYREGYGMKAKEEKYFELLRQHTEEITAAGDICLCALSGKNDREDAWKEMRDLFRNGQKSSERLEERADRIFHGQDCRGDITRLLEGLQQAAGQVRKILADFRLCSDAEAPAGAEVLAEIASASLGEISKIAGYTSDIKGNAMKATARCMKVLNYAERAESEYGEAARRLVLSGRDPVYIMQWKSILEGLESVADICTDIIYAMQRVVFKGAQ